jgi:hypothetical protein
MKAAEDVGSTHYQTSQDPDTSSSTPHATVTSTLRNFRSLTRSYATPFQREWGGLEISDKGPRFINVDSELVLEVKCYGVLYHEAHKNRF